MSLIERGWAGMAWRFLRSRKLRALLTALGVVLGVALISAMTVLGATLQASVAEQLRQGFGTYGVTAGYPTRLLTADEQALLLKHAFGSSYSVGILEVVAMPYSYVGIGEFPKGEYAYPVKAGRRPGPGEFAAEQRIADDLGIKLGDTVTLNFRSGPQQVRLVGILPTTGKASTGSLMMDLAWLQTQMGLGKQVTRLAFGLTKGERKEVLGGNLKIGLPDIDVQLRTELDDAVNNLGGLKPMAIAFGLAGLFAAGFLVAGSFNTAVHERSRELALLRAAGATPRQAMDLILGEAVLLGAGGSLAGLLLGGLGARAALAATAASLGVAQHAPVLPWVWLAIEWAGGLALAVLAAWAPARAAGRIAPLQAMRPDAVEEARREKADSVAGLVVIGIGIALVALALLLKGGSALRAFTGAFGGLAVVAGLIMALPRILPPAVSLLSRLLGGLYPAEAVLAGRSVLRHRRRGALTAATLVLGIMLLTSISTIFGEMIRNGNAYIRSQFPADAQVETDDPNGLGRDLPALISKVDGVTAVAAQASTIWGTMTNGTASQRTGLVPMDLTAISRLYAPGRVDGKLDGGGLTITRETARKQGLHLGDTLSFQPDRFSPSVAFRGLSRDARPYQITAIVDRLPDMYAAEYAADRTLFPAEPDAAVYFTYDSARKDKVKEAVQALLRQPGYGMAKLRDYGDAVAEMRQETNQRWAILGALVGVVLIISLFGLVNSVVAGLHQRRRELAALRAVGATPAQTRRQVVLEAALVGLAGSLLGLVAGFAFTASVIVALADGVIGTYPVGLYLVCLAAGPVLAALAASMPARGVSRAPLAQTLQVE